MASTYIIIAFTFLSVSAAVGLVGLFWRKEGGVGADRLDSLVGKKKKVDETADILRKSALENDKKSVLELLTPHLPSLQKIFEQADCHIKPSVLFGMGLGLALLAGTLSWIANLPIFFIPIVSLIVFSFPFLWLMFKRLSRLKKFASQLSDALELVARALRAGHSLASGMHVVAEEMPAPISDEFGRVYEEQNLGVSIEDSLRGMCDRIPNLDLKFFVTSVIIQRQTGGDLAEILDKIGYVIRERYRILGQVKALTGEGRLSGIVLIALPIFLLFVMLYIQPAYVSQLWTHPLGIKMSIVAIVLQIVGAIVIKKIVDIKV